MADVYNIYEIAGGTVYSNTSIRVPSPTWYLEDGWLRQLAPVTLTKPSGSFWRPAPYVSGAVGYYDTYVYVGGYVEDGRAVTGVRFYGTITKHDPMPDFYAVGVDISEFFEDHGSYYSFDTGFLSVDDTETRIVQDGNLNLIDLLSLRGGYGPGFATASASGFVLEYALEVEFGDPPPPAPVGPISIYREIEGQSSYKRDGTSCYYGGVQSINLTEGTLYVFPTHTNLYKDFPEDGCIPSIAVPEGGEEPEASYELDLSSVEINLDAGEGYLAIYNIEHPAMLQVEAGRYVIELTGTAEVEDSVVIPTAVRKIVTTYYQPDDGGA